MRSNDTRRMAGLWETNGEVQGGVMEIVTFGLSDDYFGEYAAELRALQLEDVADDSRLCLSARTLALSPSADGAVLSNGPYMRRFLDGYYPMRVKLRVSYPGKRLNYRRSSPVEFEAVEEGELLLDVWFEGELRTSVEFDRI